MIFIPNFIHFFQLSIALFNGVWYMVQLAECCIFFNTDTVTPDIFSYSLHSTRGFKISSISIQSNEIHNIVALIKLL